MALCRNKSLVDIGSRILGWAVQSVPAPWNCIFLKPVRYTAFSHFCGGESLEECVLLARHLQAHAGVKCIVDWSIEESSDSSAWDENLQRKVMTLRRAKEALDSNAAFMPVKLTALLSPSLLERVTSATENLTAPGGSDWKASLSSADCEELCEALVRLQPLCRAALESDIPLLLDAEQSARQPAVHLIAQELQMEFNVGGAAVVYDTIQMYLKSSPGRLATALEAAEAGGYTCAIKLVRGAYVQQERPLGVLHDSKQQTDDAYNAAARQLLSAISSKRLAAAMILATHNRASMQAVVAEMEQLGMSRNDPRVSFAQILGIVDNLTAALGLSGYNVSKLVVFGEIREVLPWLLRRAQENGDIFGAQGQEQHVLSAELRRRLTGMFRFA